MAGSNDEEITWYCGNCGTEFLDKVTECPICKSKNVYAKVHLSAGLKVEASLSKIDITQHIKPYFNISVILILFSPIMSSIISLLKPGLNGFLLSLVVSICFAIIGFYIGKYAIDKTKILFEKAI